SATRSSTAATIAGTSSGTSRRRYSQSVARYSRTTASIAGPERSSYCPWLARSETVRMPILGRVIGDRLGGTQTRRSCDPHPLRRGAAPGLVQHRYGPHRDFLRALGFALVLVRAAPEALGVVLCDHRERAAVRLDAALRQLLEVREFRGGE